MLAKVRNGRKLEKGDINTSVQDDIISADICAIKSLLAESAWSLLNEEGTELHVCVIQEYNINNYFIGRAGASPPSRTAAIIFLYIYLFIYIYLYPCRTSCPKSSTCFFFSDISIFLCRKLYTCFFFSDISIFRKLCMPCAMPCAMDHHPWILWA